MATTRQAVLLVIMAALAISSLQQADANSKKPPGKTHHGPSCDKLKATTRSVLQKVIWPTSAKIALSGIPPPEFSENVRGRIVPVGNFETSFGALEYFYRSYLRWMVCEEKKKQVAFETIARFESPALVQAGQPGASFNFSAMGVFTFNKHGRICAYDWDLRRLGLVVEEVTAAQVAAIGSYEKFIESTIQGICQAATLLCTGPNQQYTDMADCMSFLSSLPVGDFDALDQNNLVCRTLHSQLVPLRPAVHCSHIGKTGGGKCTPHPASDLFNQDYSKCSA